MRLKDLLLLLICAFFTDSLLANEEVIEFRFNRKSARQAAEVALHSYLSINIPHGYDLEHPLFSSFSAEDCDGKNQKWVIVLFHKGSAPGSFVAVFKYFGGHQFTLTDSGEGGTFSDHIHQIRSKFYCDD